MFLWNQMAALAAGNRDQAAGVCTPTISRKGSSTWDTRAMTDSDDDEVRGKELLQRTVVAILAGLTISRIPQLAPTVTMAIPTADAVTAALGRIGRTRTEYGTETSVFAVTESGGTAEKFLDHATANQRRTELLTRTLFIAQDAALREKRRARPCPRSRGRR
jgi:hypothetical protein